MLLTQIMILCDQWSPLVLRHMFSIEVIGPGTYLITSVYTVLTVTTQTLNSILILIPSKESSNL